VTRVAGFLSASGQATDQLGQAVCRPLSDNKHAFVMPTGPIECALSLNPRTCLRNALQYVYPSGARALEHALTWNRDFCCVSDTGRGDRGGVREEKKRWGHNNPRPGLLCDLALDTASTRRFLSRRATNAIQ
jgi:hypothetical protein